MFRSFRQLSSQESRASLISRSLLRNSYPSFLQISRTIFLPVLGTSFLCYFSLLTIPLPPLFVRLFSTRQAPPVMLYPHFAVALIEQPWERFSLFVLFFFFLFCFLLHLYTPARFSRHFLLAITLSLFWWFSFYIVFLNHFHCIELKCFGYFLSIRSYFSFWF